MRSPGLYQVLVVLLSTVFLCVNAGAIKKLKTTRDAIVFGKTNDVIAVLLLNDEESPEEYEVFKAAARTWRAGITFGVALHPEQDLLDRYGVSSTPALVVYRSFDEQGTTRRGRKQRVQFDTDSSVHVGAGGSLADYSHVSSFILVAGVPSVFEYPANLGPDYNARTRRAMEAPWPRLYSFSSSSHISDVRKVFGPTCERLRKEFRHTIHCALMELPASAEEERLESMLGMAGLDPDEYTGKPAVVAVSPDGTKAVWEDAATKIAGAAGRLNDEGDLSPTDKTVGELTEHVELALADAPEIPLPASPDSGSTDSDDSSRKPKGKKSKKKNKAKSKKRNKKRGKKKHDEL